MRDGFTRPLAARGREGDFERFLAESRVSLAVLSGPASGMEYPLERPRVSLGRGPGVDLAFPDPAMSREHACVEWAQGGFRVRDLGSTNGVLVEGARVAARELAHGDRFQLGEHLFQLVVEKRPREPRTYVLPDA
jgi:pSer/pThr/pTyr-binding forkhead associated (FHA) protein